MTTALTLAFLLSTLSFPLSAAVLPTILSPTPGAELPKWEAIHIRARAPIGASLEAEVTLPTDPPSTRKVALYDDGRHGDNKARDGVFGGDFNAGPLDGEFKATLSGREPSGSPISAEPVSFIVRPRPLEHANWFLALLEGALAAAIVGTILRARAGKQLFIRRIPGLSAIDEAVGRATEMGRPILFSIGLGGLGIVTLQALAVVAHVARLAARYGNRVLVPVADPTIFPVTEEAVREAYASEGRQQAYRPEDVRYLTDQQFAYAAGVVGLMNRERVASNFMFGSFFAEALILAESGHDVGAIQIAGTPSTTQLPFFIASCDYVVIGDEYYAASAYLTDEPTLKGSLVGQDIGKLALLLLIVYGVLAAPFGWHFWLLRLLGK